MLTIHVAWCAIHFTGFVNHVILWDNVWENQRGKKIAGVSKLIDGQLTSPSVYFNLDTLATLDLGLGIIIELRLASWGTSLILSIIVH